MRSEETCTQYAPTMTNEANRDCWLAGEQTTRSITRQSSPIHFLPPLFSPLALFLNGKIGSNRTNIIGRRQHLSELENAHTEFIHYFNECCNEYNKSENFAPFSIIIVRQRQSDRY